MPNIHIYINEEHLGAHLLIGTALKGIEPLKPVDNFDEVQNSDLFGEVNAAFNALRDALTMKDHDLIQQFAANLGAQTIRFLTEYNELEGGANEEH